MDVSIIGGAGHVGLSMGLVVAQAGHTARLIDQDSETLENITAGQLPYKEKGGAEILEGGLEENLIHTTTDVTEVANSDVIIIVVGTPIDEHNNPQMDQLLEIVEELEDHLEADQLVLLRSTVYPGTTAIVRDVLETAGFEVGEDLYLSFAPERIAQHHAIEEMVELPQLVGSFDQASFDRSRAFFETFLEAECHRLTPTEAELGKLFTNMWRYLTFAIANEFYLITDSLAQRHDVNIHRILDKTATEYPRFDVPTPGANVGGPCLTKDGWFLTDDIPYNELVSAAFQINEGMPAQIIQRMSRLAPDPEKITILGMTFKGGSDDTRNSLAFKLEKQLKMRGLDGAVRIEPNRPEFDDWADAEGSDWVILMTPHPQFEDFDSVRSRIDNPDCLYCDIWGHWEAARYVSDNGYFFGERIGGDDERVADYPLTEGR